MRHAILAICIVFASGCSPSESSLKTYNVRDVSDADVVVDGTIEEPAWTDAKLETEFSFSWQERKAPATEFRALTDDSYFYFAFRVEDADIVVDSAFCGSGEAGPKARTARISIPCMVSPPGLASRMGTSLGFEKVWKL